MKNGETLASLPSYQLQTNTAVASTIAAGNIAGNKQSKNIFTSKTWTGLTPYNNPRKTPILYHRGSWQAINRDDPEADPPNDPFPTRNYIRYEQHGLGWDEYGGEIRLPRCILYNYRLAPAASNGQWADVGASFDLVPTYWSSLSSSLEANHVLTASLNDQQGFGGCFIASVLPGYDTASDDAYVEADPAGYATVVDYRRLIDVTRFTGGHLLVLNAVVSYDGALGVTGYFRNTGAPGSLSARYWGNNSLRTDYDIAAWIAAYAQFASLTQYVYIRERRDTASLTADSATATAHITSTLSSLTSYGVTFRSAVEATVDIGSTVAADVATWLSGLP